MNKETTQLSPTLSIRISTDGFCFCTYLPQQPDSVKYSYHECDEATSLSANFAAAWEESGLAGRKYNNIQVIVSTTEFTTIPAEYDNSEEYETIYGSCFPASEKNVKILSNRLSAHNLTVLFTIDEELHESLCEIGEVTYYSPVSIIMGFLTRYPREEKRVLTAYLQGGKSLLIAMEEGRPLLMNGFASEETQDQLYYLLCIWNELEFSQLEDTLLLCGDTHADAMEMSAKNFIRNISRVNPREQFRSNLLNKIENIPFDLQTLLLCE